jgi:hypothetical protein
LPEAEAEAEDHTHLTKSLPQVVVVVALVEQTHLVDMVGAMQDHLQAQAAQFFQVVTVILQLVVDGVLEQVADQHGLVTGSVVTAAAGAQQLLRPQGFRYHSVPGVLAMAQSPKYNHTISFSNGYI